MFTTRGQRVSVAALALMGFTLLLAALSEKRVGYEYLTMSERISGKLDYTSRGSSGLVEECIFGRGQVSVYKGTLTQDDRQVYFRPVNGPPELVMLDERAEAIVAEILLAKVPGGLPVSALGRRLQLVYTQEHGMEPSDGVYCLSTIRVDR